MSVVVHYGDLLMEIESYKMRIEDLEREVYALDQLSHTNKIPLDSYLEKKITTTARINIMKEIVKDKENTRDEMVKRIQRLEGLEHKIAYKRFIEGKSLIVISEELHVSESWAKKMSAKIKKYA